MAHQRHICVLVSGGLDSAVLLSRLAHPRRRLLPLYVRCGLRWEAAEVEWLRRLLRAVRTPQMEPLCLLDVPLQPLYQGHWSLTGRGVPSARSADAAVYLPGRNLLLITPAAIYAARHGISEIALGTLAGNPFGDAQPDFFRQVGRCMSQALARPIRVTAPLRRLSKAALIASMPGEPLHLTYSCIQPSGRRHCGRCNKCAERRRAFRRAGVPDRTVYAANR